MQVASKLSQFLAELKRREVYNVAAAYAAEGVAGFTQPGAAIPGASGAHEAGMGGFGRVNPSGVIGEERP